MISFDFSTLSWAALGGILPAFIWLAFWLTEDSRHPEPKRLLVSAFTAGAIGVPLAFFLEKFALGILGSGIFIIIVWSAIEELLKYGAAYFVAFRGVCLDRSICVDEPLDPLIYMITAALGFAALENTLFLINPLLSGDTLSGILTGNLRFIGATLLHIVASGTVGFFMGISFYKNLQTKRKYFLLGITAAIALHALFNLSIMIYKGANLFLIFLILWFVVGALLVGFEKIKRIHP